MSATLQRLERLLSRVQERRAAPRAQPLAMQPLAMQPLAAQPLAAQPPATQPLATQAPDLPFSSPPPGTGRVSKAPVRTPLEESMEQVVPVERPRETQPNPFEAKTLPKAPESEELFLDDFEPPPTIAPAAITAKPAALPRAAAAAPAFRAEPATGQTPFAAPLPIPASAPITAASARIVPAAPVAAASPISAVSKARSIEPKTFGELLDLSLGLRPAK